MFVIESTKYFELYTSRYIDMAETLCQKRALEAFRLDPAKWGGKCIMICAFEMKLLSLNIHHLVHLCVCVYLSFNRRDTFTYSQANTCAQIILIVFSLHLAKWPVLRNLTSLRVVFYHISCSQCAVSIWIPFQLSSLYCTVEASWENHGTWSSTWWTSFTWLSGKLPPVLTFVSYKFMAAMANFMW